MKNCVLEFEKVSFGYDDARPVLDDASFRISKGAFVTIKGPFSYRSSRGAKPPTEQTVRRLLDESQLSEVGTEDFASHFSVGQNKGSV